MQLESTEKELSFATQHISDASSLDLPVTTTRFLFIVSTWSFAEAVEVMLLVLIGAVDQGTSSTRFLAFVAETGQLVTYHQLPVQGQRVNTNLLTDFTILYQRTYEKKKKSKIERWVVGGR